ncbi:isoleucine--tRNA ligase [Candidatus Woesearchaeota archaeon]|nr:isoleucine--tRNA ligase [Candidatus Woesearchaeota archaeon]
MLAERYDPKTIEPEILSFWEKNKIYQKAKDKNKGKKSFYFLDGPPYTSGSVHIGTAWNKSLKDMMLRYKRMRGFDVWDRAGYDMHGLPSEHKVQDKFNVHLKDEIIKFGVAKFVKECENLCIANMHSMSNDFVRMGVWMDFDNAYQSIKKEFIEGEWWLIKQAHDNGRLYESFRTMTWCPHCETSVAKHELEYETVKDNSIFVKFKVRNAQNEFLIVWTTTPWTVPFNLAVMVNPDINYVKAKVDDEVWIVAKPLSIAVIGAVAGKQFKVIEELKGSALDGLEYEHPFCDAIKAFSDLKKQSVRVHTVILSSEYVDTTAGTGLVHCAPGCGPEDYEVGHKYGIPAFNTVDERGVFQKDTGEFAGFVAKKDDARFVDALRKRNAIIETTEVEHEYAHCWRCHKPVIFRTTKQWFFKVEDLKEKMLSANKEINWVPDAAFNAFDSWLKNLRDNSISKQNFWGTPLPVWRCNSCNGYEVISTVAELEQRSRTKVGELHKPWIDDVEIPCACGQKKKRVPDILDVWVDAGTTSWNCLDFPQRKDLFEKLYPAEFILEGKDQIRGWFNLLMVSSMIALGRPSFKSVYMHGFIQDALGRKMSKSLGNYILPEEVIGVHGADTLRYYLIGATSPGLDLNYNHEDAKLKSKNLGVLWNIHNFVLDLARTNNVNPAKLDVKIVEKHFSVEEKYILSRLHSAILHVTQCFDEHRLNEVPLLVEELFLDLSRTYIQLVREKSSIGSVEDKQAVLLVLYTVFLETLKLFAPVAPFIAEKMFQNLKSAFGLKEESIHLFGWPVADKKFMNPSLEQNMVVAQRVVQAVLAAREKAQLGVRWPVKNIEVVTSNADVESSVESMEELIKVQANVKEVHLHQKLPRVKETVSIDHGKIGVLFGSASPKILAKLSMTPANKLIDELTNDGKVVVLFDSQRIELSRDVFIVNRLVPPEFVEVEFKDGFVYLNKVMDAALEAEGFSRELMRRIQSLRKNAGLEKQQRIGLFVKLSAGMRSRLAEWKDKIAEKVGASSIAFETVEPQNQYSQKSVEKIKAEEFVVWFDVL